MKAINELLPHEQESIILATISEAELVSGRSLDKEQKEGIKNIFINDLKGKFKWVTPEYLHRAVQSGMATEFKYLDLKTIYKWLWDIKNSPEMRLKIALESPLIPANEPEWKNINWQMETNKAFNRFITGGNIDWLNTGVYSRMLLDGFIQLNAYQKYYEGEDIYKIQAAQRKIVKEKFKEFQDLGWKLIYDPNQFFKTPLNENK
jgi:hypothetical protein